MSQTRTRPYLERKSKSFGKSKEKLARFLKTYESYRSCLIERGTRRRFYDFKESKTGRVENVNHTLDKMLTAGQRSLNSLDAEKSRFSKHLLPEEKLQVINDVFGYKKSDHSHIRAIRYIRKSYRGYRYVRTRRNVLKVRLNGDNQDREILYSFTLANGDSNSYGTQSAFFFVDVGNNTLRLYHFMYSWKYMNIPLDECMRTPEIIKNLNRDWFLYDTQDFTMENKTSEEYVKYILSAVMSKKTLLASQYMMRTVERENSLYMLHFNSETRERVQLDSYPKHYDEEWKQKDTLVPCEGANEKVMFDMIVLQHTKKKFSSTVLKEYDEKYIKVVKDLKDELFQEAKKYQSERDAQINIYENPRLSSILVLDTFKFYQEEKTLIKNYNRVVDQIKKQNKK